ncbi:MAG: hypothetical protein OEZ06_02040 [Myxococcales bacterium]|nr:hypothetical protein [Myxococcales bacterium]
MRIWKSIFALCLLLGLWPGRAAAGGLELLPGGTRSVARGGAVAARPEDPMTQLHNPAGLTKLPGVQFLFSLELPLHDMCVDPYGYYGWGVYEAGTTEFGDQLALENPNDPQPGLDNDYASSPLPKVCNSARSLPIPQIGLSIELTDQLSIGIGHLFPTVVPGMQFGGPDGTIETELAGTTVARPTPTRYQLIKQEVVAGFAPSFAVAYQAVPTLSFGLNLQLAIVKAKTWVVQNAVAGTQPSTDMLAELEAEDLFVPSLTFSVFAEPTPAIDLMASFRWVDNFDGSGSVKFETNTYPETGADGGVPETAHENKALDLSQVKVGLPWALTLGFRYSGLLSGGVVSGVSDSRRAPDPMDSELWDVELDLGYSFNARAGKNTVQAGEDVVLYTRDAKGDGGRIEVDLDDLSQFDIDRHLKDSVTLRLGGSYSIVPRQVALHAGTFYESRGVEPEYVNIDTFALARVGVGIGVLWRLGMVDLTASYGHIFQEQFELAPPAHEPLPLPEGEFDEDNPPPPDRGFDQRVGGTFGADGVRQGGVVLEDPDAPAPGEGDATAALQQEAAVSTVSRPNRVINAGKYTASFDVIAIGVNLRF